VTKWQTERRIKWWAEQRIKQRPERRIEWWAKRRIKRRIKWGRTVVDRQTQSEQQPPEVVEFRTPEAAAASPAREDEWFTLDERLRELRKDGQKIPLQPKPMSLLWYLIRHRDRVVSGDELRAQVWQDVHVGEQALSGTLRDLRRALGTEGRSLVQTLRGHGYRFTGELRSVAPGSAPAPSAEVSVRRPGASLDVEPLVGRDAEVQQLSQLLQEAQLGTSVLCSLVGEAGIGKSRLIDALVPGASALGFQIHKAAAHSAQGEPPYWLWTQIVRSLLQQEHMLDHAAELPPGTHAIRMLLPELASVETKATLLDSFQQTSPRFELAHGIVQLLRAVTRNRPQLIVLEDLHWADHDSLSVLEIIAHDANEVPLMIVLSVRETELSPELKHALALVARARRHERIRLQGLGLEAVGILLQQSPDSLPLEIIARIHQVTTGNPLFVAELGKLHAQGQLETNPTSLQRVPIPTAVREALELQLANRTPECQRALRIAAVSGDNFSLEILRRVLDVQREALLDALSEAERSGLIHELDTQPGQYRFHHSLWREVLYAQFTKTDVRRLHLRTGEALEAAHAHDLASAASALARHFAAAAPVGGAEKAAHYATLAAQRSERLWAATDAASHYRVALDALGQLPQLDPSRRCELLIAYGLQLRVQVRRGDVWNEARESLQEATRIARELGRADLFARALVSQVVLEFEPFLVWPSSQATRLARIAQLEGLLREALDTLTDADAIERVQVKIWIAFARHLSHDLATRDELIDESESSARQLDDPELLRTCYLARWWFSQTPDTFTERERVSEILASTWTDGLPSTLLSRVGPLVFVKGEQGDFAGADKLVYGSRTRIERRYSEDPHVWTWYCMRALMAGDFAAARVHLDRLSQIDEFMIRISCDAQRLWLGILEGGPDPESIQTAVRTADDIPSPLYLLPVARYQVEVGQAEQARAGLARALRDGVEAISFDQQWLFTLTLAADVMHLAEQDSEAEAIYQALLPHRDRMAIAGWCMFCAGAVNDALGMLASLRKRWDVAISHLEEALELHERLGSHALAARTHEALALARAGRGRTRDTTRAREHGVEAERLALQIGMRGLAARAARLRSRFGASPAV